MNTSKIYILGFLVCAGMVQIIRADKITIALKPQSTKVQYEYALVKDDENGIPDVSSLTYKKVAKSGVKLSFDDAVPSYLHVRQIGGKQPAQILHLKNTAKRISEGLKTIVIDADGTLGYRP